VDLSAYCNRTNSLILYMDIHVVCVQVNTAILRKFSKVYIGSGSKSSILRFLVSDVVNFATEESKAMVEVALKLRIFTGVSSE